MRDIHHRIAREVYEEERGMTPTLKRKISEVSRGRGHRLRKITPAEHQTILDIFGGNEDGRGWFMYGEAQVAFSPQSMWRI